MPAPPSAAQTPNVVSNLNPANAITAARLLAPPVFAWALAHEAPQVAVFAVAACAFLDLFDGLVARALRCATPFGEVFDGIADGVCYASFAALVAVHGLAPAGAVAIILGVGVINFAMRFQYARRLGRAANYRSFAMEKLVGFVAFLAPVAVMGWSVAFYYWTFTVLLCVVVVHDAKRMLFDPVPAAAVGQGESEATP